MLTTDMTCPICGDVVHMSFDEAGRMDCRCKSSSCLLNYSLERCPLCSGLAMHVESRHQTSAVLQCELDHQWTVTLAQACRN
jgi:hypothetical protein